MARTVKDLASKGRGTFPPPGWHRVSIKTARKRENKVGVLVELWFDDGNGNEFSDALWLNPEGMGRLSLVASRICDAGDVALPDEDADALMVLSDIILDTAPGRDCEVEIRPSKKGDLRVSYSGYRAVPAETGDAPAAASEQAPDEAGEPGPENPETEVEMEAPPF